MDGLLLSIYQEVILNGWAKSGFDQFNVFKIYNKNGHGYVLEVVVEYPEKTHDLHNDLPLAPESIRLIKCINYCLN